MVSVVKKLLPGAAGTAGAGGGDDDFNLVTHLYHFNGSNAANNNTFLDSSSNNHTVTAGANVPIQGAFSPFSCDEGKWSLEIPPSTFGTGVVNLGIAATSDFAFGTGDYTLEAWVFPRSLANSATIGNFIIDFRSSGNTGGNFMYIGVNGSGDGVLVPYSGNAVTGITLHEWNHIAVSRESGTERTFINGVLKGSNSNTTNFSTNATATIGSRYAVNSGNWSKVDGYISNLRVVKGTAVYTSAFTPSTSPLTAVTNTKLLTCCSNRFRDKSTSAHSFTFTGVPKIKPFGPFKNTAEYDPAAHGGSILFEQTANSWLEVDHATLFDFGTADYCIEAWLYPTQTSFSTNWAMWFATKGVNQYWAYTDGGGNEAAAGFSSYPYGAYSGDNDHILKPFSWNHCVFQNTGGYENWYLNGTRIYNAQNTPNHGSAATGVRIGNSPSYASYFYYGGYISDLRVTTGANYNPYSNATTLTVPTAPLTSGSYTRLLLNGTNAGIIDSSRKHNIEAVGNTNLNTSVKKFGTASAKFDESGDYLSIRPSAQAHHVDLGKGPFTIEGWVYFNSSPTDGQGLFQFDNQILGSANGRGPALGTYNGTGKWHRYWGQVGDVARFDGVGDSASTPAATTWIHFAYVRDTSNVHKIFIDGTQIGNSITYDADYTASNILTIGGYYSSSFLLNGYIDDFRITLKARYTSNFTVPDAQHPSI